MLEAKPLQCVVENTFVLILNEPQNLGELNKKPEQPSRVMSSTGDLSVNHVHQEPVFGEGQEAS